MKYDKVLLLSDMDGTILNDDKVVSKKNQEALNKFVEQGGLFAFATGRTQHNAKEYLDSAPVNAPCILYNGSALFDLRANVMLEKCLFETEKMKSFLQFIIKKYPKTSIQIYTEDIIIVPTFDATYDPYLLTHPYLYRELNLDDASKLEWLKVLFYDNNEVLQEVKLDMLKHYSVDEVSIAFSNATYLEILPDNMSKGKMMLKMKTMPEYKDKFIVTTGDYENDYEMIRLSDYGIAPSNACDKVKTVANEISVSCNEDLLYEIIENIIPNLK